MHFEEPCDSKAIRFVFNARRINPYNAAFLKKSLTKSASVKILVHGYGGLGIDYAIKNVSAAYKAAGYNTIVGNKFLSSKFPCKVMVFNFFSGLVVFGGFALLRHSVFEHMARGSVCSGSCRRTGVPRRQTGRNTRHWF